MTTEQQPDRFPPQRDHYTALYPNHCCAFYDCPAPIHLSCVGTQKPLTAADILWLCGEERYAGFSVEGLHEAPWHADCRAGADESAHLTGILFRHHYSWWSVPLELLEEP